MSEYIHPQQIDNMEAAEAKVRNWTNPTAKVLEVRRQVLPARVTWDGNIQTFSIFKSQIVGHYCQTGAGYLFNTDFHPDYF